MGSVVDRVSDEEEGEEGDDDGLSAGVGAVKVTGLDSTATTGGGGALGKGLVEADDALHPGGGATGAGDRLGRSDLGRDGEARRVSHLLGGASASNGGNVAEEHGEYRV